MGRPWGIMKCPAQGRLERIGAAITNQEKTVFRACFERASCDLLHDEGKGVSAMFSDAFNGYRLCRLYECLLDRISIEPAMHAVRSVEDLACEQDLENVHASPLAVGSGAAHTWRILL